eukprot:3658299-Amphidinium_carterae.1
MHVANTSWRLCKEANVAKLTTLGLDSAMLVPRHLRRAAPRHAVVAPPQTKHKTRPDTSNAVACFSGNQLHQKMKAFRNLG